MSNLTDPEGFLNEVRTAFSNLLQRGALRIQSSTYSPKSFGNALVELTGQNFAVRVIRDRGDTLADAKPLATSDWRPLERMIPAAGGPDVGIPRVMPIPEIAELVEKNISFLEAGCAPDALDATLQELQRIEKQWDIDRQIK